MIPGEVIPAAGEIELNAGRELPCTITVANTGDRPIQVGSHYHFSRRIPRFASSVRKRVASASDITGGHGSSLRARQSRSDPG